MKKSRLQRDESSFDSNSASTSVAVPDKCECHYRFKDMNVYLNNFEKDQERKRFLELFKKIKVKQEGIWKNLFGTSVKTGCPSGDSAGPKRAIAVKQKVNKNSTAAIKKAAKIKSGTMGTWSSKNCVFQHNVPIEQTLQEYRENNIYSKARMRLVNKVAILNAAHSSASNKQAHVPSIIIEPRVTVPRETCATVLNLSFDDSMLAQHGGSKIWKPRTPNEKSINVGRRPGMNASSSRSFEMIIKQLFPNTKTGQWKQSPAKFK